MTIVSFLLNYQKIKAQNTDLSSQITTTINIEIPKQLKSNFEVNKNNKSSLSVNKKYVELLEGYIVILSDAQGKIVEITAPESVNPQILINEQTKIGVPCSHCLGDDGYDSSCVLACIISAIIGKDKKE